MKDDFDFSTYVLCALLLVIAGAMTTALLVMFASAVVPELLQ